LKETDKSQTGRLSVTGASESSQPAATHRFLPKVILLIILILVGFMFVRPFANKDAAKEQTEMAAPAVEQQAPAVAAAEAAVAGKPGDFHALRQPAVYAEKASEPASPPVPAAPAPELAAPEQAAAEPAQAAVAPATPTTAAANWTDPAAPSAGSRRSRLMGEYEARRKAAWDNSRRRYERMRRPMPAPWGVGQVQRLYYVNPYQLRGN
jgi:cytoskeletal protein RodZ